MQTKCNHVTVNSNNLMTRRFFSSGRASCVMRSGQMSWRLAGPYEARPDPLLWRSQGVFQEIDTLVIILFYISTVSFSKTLKKVEWVRTILGISAFREKGKLIYPSRVYPNVSCHIKFHSTSRNWRDSNFYWENLKSQVKCGKGKVRAWSPG